MHKPAFSIGFEVIKRLLRGDLGPTRRVEDVEVAKQGHPVAADIEDPTPGSTPQRAILLRQTGNPILDTPISLRAPISSSPKPLYGMLLDRGSMICSGSLSGLDEPGV